MLIWALLRLNVSVNYFFQNNLKLRLSFHHKQKWTSFTLIYYFHMNLQIWLGYFCGLDSVWLLEAVSKCYKWPCHDATYPITPCFPTFFSWEKNLKLTSESNKEKISFLDLSVGLCNGNLHTDLPVKATDCHINISNTGAITKFKKSVVWTINKFWFNNSLAINGTVLGFAYQKIDVQRSTFSNFWNFCCS